MNKLRVINKLIRYFDKGNGSIWFINSKNELEQSKHYDIHDKHISVGIFVIACDRKNNWDDTDPSEIKEPVNYKELKISDYKKTWWLKKPSKLQND